MAEKKVLNFTNIQFSSVLVCDNCERKLYPRKDVAFRDSNYGLTFCNKCRSDYIKSQQTQVK